MPWELSRFQHLPVLAAAYRLTGDRAWVDEIGSQLVDWIAANPVELGVNWACTMDVAIRAANWTAALSLIDDAAVDQRWTEPVLASLLLHGRFIRSHLEWATVRGNHYLADVVGLLCLASIFSGGAEGRAWVDWASAELIRELAHHVHGDGCDHEASIPYHRLVTELFVCGLQAAEALAPGSVSAREHERLDRMLAFVSNYTRPDGLAPQVGDADDGRFLPLADYGRADPRSHLHLFEQAGRQYTSSTSPSAYPEGGYWVARAGELYLLVRCGDVGVGGAHAHNDALSFEVSFGSQPLIIDPGSYLYSADPSERNRFRSTGFHSTLEIDDAEQNPIQPDLQGLFKLEDIRRAHALRWEADAAHAVFEGRHFGYERLTTPATHTRRIEAKADPVRLTVTDTVSSAGEHDLKWTFPLAPSEISVSPGGVIATFESGVILELEADEVAFSVDQGWLSPSYGRRLPTPFVRARRRGRPGDEVTVFTIRVHTVRTDQR